MTEKKDIASTWISRILFVGSLCAAALLALGLGLLWIRGSFLDHAGNVEPSSVSNFFSALMGGEPVAFINLGILAMMLTPFLRVVAAVISFLMEKDYRYAAVGVGVTIILLFTILPGFL